MNEELPNLDENELSDEDFAVLRAFEAMEDWSEQPAISPNADPSLPQDTVRESLEYSSEDMLLVFVTEVDEDIATMRRMLNQLEQEAHIKPERFMTFRRLGHKIRGSAGAIECHALARIAQHIEEISEQIMQGTVFPVIGVNALTHAVSAMEVTLRNVIIDGNEHPAPLIELENILKNLLADRTFEKTTDTEDQPYSGVEKQSSLVSGTPEDITPSIAHTRVDVQRLKHLLYRSEQLMELRTPLESAQAQVNSAIQGLHAAQARLAQLERMFFTLLTIPRYPPPVDELPTSSLMARILNQAGQRNDSAHSRHSRKNRPRSRLARTTEAAMWDELDIEHYTEQDLLLRSLQEAISEVNTASSHVNIAFEHLCMVMHDYTTQVTVVRNDTLLLRLVPLRMLVPRLQEVITTNAVAQGRHIQFEVVGDATEIDQQILDALSSPLLHLLQTCSTDISLANTTGQEPSRIWLRAQEIGNEIAVEIGFSVAVNGGAVEPLREVIQRLNGRLSLQRNSADGVSFHLCLPRSQGTIHCLLLRANDQHIIVPFSQVQRIGDRKREHFDKLYSLHDLLGSQAPSVFTERIQPALVLLQGESPVSIAVTVDEVVDDVELVVKPLPSYLQRPGITSAAISGQGSVLLMADLPELVRHYTQIQHNASKENPAQPARQSPPKILLADDSVYLRQTVVHMLKHANYVVLEARDGLEALEQLIQQTPDIFLLDIEMPNLNGYDLLGIMRLYPALASVKIIMLTSRSSEKHMQHALDLGAHAYLTKPCTQETLIETIQKLLRN